MVFTLEILFLGIALLFLISIIANKFGERLGVPALLIFLIVGMLAGSEGPGGIPFDAPALVQTIGVIALAYILFSGGFDTRWDEIQPICYPGTLARTALLPSSLRGWLLHRCGGGLLRPPYGTGTPEG